MVDSVFQESDENQRELSLTVAVTLYGEGKS